MNTQPCGKCVFYDPIMKNTGRGRQIASNSAWCAKRSVYPHTEKDGQVFPDGVRRAESTQHAALPVIVHPNQVVSSCPHFQATNNGKMR